MPLNSFSRSSVTRTSGSFWRSMVLACGNVVATWTTSAIGATALSYWDNCCGSVHTSKTVLAIFTYLSVARRHRDAFEIVDITVDPDALHANLLLRPGAAMAWRRRGSPAMRISVLFPLLRCVRRSAQGYRPGNGSRKCDT